MPRYGTHIIYLTDISGVVEAPTADQAEKALIEIARTEHDSESFRVIESVAIRIDDPETTEVDE